MVGVDGSSAFTSGACPPMLIVLVGPDGCGKTTVAQALISQRESLGFDGAIHKATNFGFLPTISALKKRVFSIFGLVTQQNEIRERPGEYLSGMRRTPNSALHSSLLICWYGVDYFLGRSIITRAKRANELVVFARYFHDFYYQRVHLNAPPWVVKFVELIVPKPDLIVLLDRSPENIFKIKPELTIQEIIRQNEAIKNALQTHKRFRVVNVVEDIEATVEAVKLLILDRYEN